MSRRFSRRQVRFGGPAIFTPRSIPGLVAWYRADLGVTIATGVSGWADQSGNGNTLTQATGSKQPTRTAADAAYNNQSTLSYASASLQCLQSAAFGANVSQAYTIIIVGETGGSGTQALFDGRDSTNRCEVYISATLPRAFAGAFLNAVSAGSAKNCLIAVINGASSSIYISAQTADVTADAGTNALAGITVGSAFDQTSDPLNGKVAEVMLYSRALSASERLSILRYSSTRYGTAVGA